jgi:hypothetical protein
VITKETITRHLKPTLVASGGRALEPDDEELQEETA